MEECAWVLILYVRFPLLSAVSSVPHCCSGFCLGKCHCVLPNAVLFVMSFWAMSACHCCCLDAQLGSSCSQAEGQPALPCCSSRWLIPVPTSLRVLHSLFEVTPLHILQKTHSRITWLLCHSRHLCLAFFSFLQKLFPSKVLICLWVLPSSLDSFWFSASVARRDHHARFCTSLEQMLFQRLDNAPRQFGF